MTFLDWISQLKYRQMEHITGEIESTRLAAVVQDDYEKE
jgi:hypothetical protein